MGMSADATIAWGVDIYCEGYTYDDDNEATAELREELAERVGEMDERDLDKILGWTEEFPSPWPPQYSPEYEAHKLKIQDYHYRHDQAVPVDFDFYGTYECSGRVLVIKRTRTRANWGSKKVRPESLALPTEDEITKLNIVLNALGYPGNPEPELLLFAMYG